MSLHLILGPMFAGKSSELLRLGRRNELAGKHVVYVKHELDCQRYSDKRREDLRTHDGNSTPGIIGTRLDRLWMLHDARVDVVCIDEGQFFNDLAHQVARLCNQEGKQVIVAALSATYEQQLFPSIAKILPLADKVDWLSAVCFRCGSQIASFTHRLEKNESNKEKVFYNFI